jgi:hypothetical protein
MSSAGISESLIMLLVACLCMSIIVVPFWRIATRAGHPGWYSLVAVIPVVNLIALYLFAFTRWPAEDRR